MTVSTHDDDSTSGSTPATAMPGVYDRAAARWPRVQWPRPSYEAHLAYVRGLQPDAPRCHGDLDFRDDHWLGSAAGYQAEQSWEAIEADIKPNCFAGIRNHPADLAGYADRDELWQDTVTDKYLMNPTVGPPMLPGHRPPNKLAEYRGDCRLSTFFNVTLRRKLKDHGRRKGTRARRDEKYEDFVHANPPPPTAPPDQRADDQERRAAAQRDLDQARRAARDGFRRAFRRLSPRQRLIYREVFVEGKDRKDVAYTLGVDPGTVTRDIRGYERNGKHHPGLQDLLREELGEALDLFMDLDRPDETHELDDDRSA